MTSTSWSPAGAYDFRVMAVNDEGLSEPLVTDKPIVAKHQFGMFHSNEYE